MEGWGTRVFRARRFCLADLRREVVCGLFGEADWREVRVWRREDSVDMVADCVLEVGGSEGVVRDMGGARAAGGGASSGSGAGVLSQVSWDDKYSHLVC